jgi:hypothetical protein
MQKCSYFYLYSCKRAVFSKITALLQDNAPNGGAAHKITALLQDGAPDRCQLCLPTQRSADVVLLGHPNGNGYTQTNPKRTEEQAAP